MWRHHLPPVSLIAVHLQTMTARQLRIIHESSQLTKPIMTSSTPSTPPDLPSLVTSLSSPSAARLKALYAFTSAQQQTNPSGYQANVAWWTQTLEDGLREGLVGRTGPSSAAGDVRDRLILHANEDALLQSIEWPGVGRPKGVGGVLVS